MRTNQHGLRRLVFSVLPLSLLLVFGAATARAEVREAAQGAPAAAAAPSPEESKPLGAEKELALPKEQSPDTAKLQPTEPIKEETTEENVIGPAGTFQKTEENTDSLLVESRPEGARVFVDGEEKGKTPVTLKDLGDGGHEVVLYLSGYGAFRQSVTGKGGRILIDLRMEKGIGIGFVTVTTVPPDARVDVNGHKSGLSPLELPLEAGHHLIHVSKAGFKDADLPVEIAKDAKKTLEIQLEPKEGALLVLSNPTGADVTLDGQAVGRTSEPLAVKDVPPGVHAVRVSKQGYRPWEKSDVVIRSDRATTILAALLPERDHSWVRLYSRPVGAKVWLDGEEIGTTSDEGLAFKTTKGAHGFRLEVNPAVMPGFQPLHVALTFSEDEVDLKATPLALPPIDENYTNALQLIERGKREEALGFLDRVAPGHPSYAQARLTVVDILRELGRVRDIPAELSTLLGRPEYRANPAINLAMGYWSLIAAKELNENDSKALLAQGLEALDRAIQGTDRFPTDNRDALALKAHYFTGIASEILFNLTGEKKHVKKGAQAWELFFARLDQTPKAMEDSWIEKARRHRQSLEYLAKKLGS